MVKKLSIDIVMEQAVYENGELIELYMDKQKTIRVHKNMINEIDLYVDLP